MSCPPSEHHLLKGFNTMLIATEQLSLEEQLQAYSTIQGHQHPDQLKLIVKVQSINTHGRIPNTTCEITNCSIEAIIFICSEKKRDTLYGNACYLEIGIYIVLNRTLWTC